MALQGIGPSYFLSAIHYFIHAYSLELVEDSCIAVDNHCRTGIHCHYHRLHITLHLVAFYCLFYL